MVLEELVLGKLGFSDSLMRQVTWVCTVNTISGFFILFLKKEKIFSHGNNLGNLCVVLKSSALPRFPTDCNYILFKNSAFLCPFIVIWEWRVGDICTPFVQVCSSEDMASLAHKAMLRCVHGKDLPRSPSPELLLCAVHHSWRQLCLHTIISMVHQAKHLFI